MGDDPTRRVTAEFIGTFWLVSGGCGSAVLAASYPQLGIGFLGVSSALGLSVLSMAYAVGHISGGHFNPAVTLGLWTADRCANKHIVPYVAAQVVAAIAAAEAPELARAEDIQPVPKDQPRAPAEIAKLWEAERQRSVAATRFAIPFTPLAVVADFEESTAARRGVIAILPCEDCDVARTANARFPALWQAAPTTIIAHMARPDAVVTTALLNQGAGCTAVIRVATQAATDTIVNPV